MASSSGSHSTAHRIDLFRGLVPENSLGNSPEVERDEKCPNRKEDIKNEEGK